MFNFVQFVCLPNESARWFSKDAELPKPEFFNALLMKQQQQQHPDRMIARRWVHTWCWAFHSLRLLRDPDGLVRVIHT